MLRLRSSVNTVRSDDLIKILTDLGLSRRMKIINSTDDTNFMFCCPWHGEKRPSCGISLNKLRGGCFACGQSFHISQLVMHVKDFSFSKAMEWLEERVKIDKQQSNKVYLRQFEDMAEKEDYEIFTMSHILLAVFLLRRK